MAPVLKARRRRTRQHLHTAYLHAASSQGINADCVDLDVHHWRVQICDITPLGLTRVFVCVTSFSSYTHLFTDGS